MKKRFIILIDFSEYSGNLLKYACDWNKHVNAELLLVHQTTVLAPVFTDYDRKKSIAEQGNDEALQKLKALAKRLIPPTVKVSYCVSESNLEITLPKLLEEAYENLIFVGLKGTGFLKKIFIGSVALEVIDNIKSIVVAMPREIATFSHEKIFVAVTEKHPLNLLELNNFLELIDKKNTRITFFYLSKPNEKTIGTEKLLRDLSELFAERFTTTFAIYEGSNPFDDIKKVINNKIDEMLIVQKGSRHLTDQLFRKFLINELVYEGQTPLVILP
ncbi:universal stress protein [Flavobacterium caseinilyticum]|uniref:Universal stress protein n=1 Tax=Flavobacterium caseinilyticum TaxID=2541732 RepID=A0A4R5AQ37_9FLAO|nr:universal stress protein [Flavobacterium caseinilyticum]TDD73940.1 universal stress protein [Flavobacterium caseinilyticum]